MQQKKQTETILFSAAGLVLMLVVLVGAYLIAGVVRARVDLTEDNVYTLSKGTRQILSELDTPVEMRFYVTEDSKAMPMPLKNYADRVEDFLAEYKKAAGGNLIIKKYDPQPDSDAENLARLDGVEGRTVGFGDRIYFGVAVSQLDAKAVIPFLSPEREPLLEYDLSRAITSVTKDEKPVVGVMSSLPVFGRPTNPMMMMQRQQQQSEPWVFLQELERDFEVQEVDMTAEEIPGEVDLLVVIHPKNLPDPVLFGIDQFLLKGGELVVFVDPVSIIDTQNSPQNNPLQAAAQGGSNLGKLFGAWGVEFDDGQVVADLRYATRINQNGQIQDAPAVLSLDADAVNKDDVVTAQVNSILLPFAGAFKGTPGEGIERTVLMHTSEQAQLVDRFMAQFSGEEIKKEVTGATEPMALAVRLQGNFKSAFPNGKPASPAGEEEEETAPAGAALKESEKASAVILVGDTDLLADQFSVRVGGFLGQRVVIPQNGNLNLVQNMTEQMAGDENLIAVRSRASMNRPFQVVREMQVQAEQRHQDKIRELEASLAEAQARLNELQREKPQGQQLIFSPEQQAEVERFRQKEAEISKELQEVRRNLRKDVDALQNRLQWANILGMPLLVTLIGIVLAIFKKRRTAAK